MTIAHELFLLYELARIGASLTDTRESALRFGCTYTHRPTSKCVVKTRAKQKKYVYRMSSMVVCSVSVLRTTRGNSHSRRFDLKVDRKQMNSSCKWCCVLATPSVPLSLAHSHTLSDRPFKTTRTGGCVRMAVALKHTENESTTEWQRHRSKRRSDRSSSSSDNNNNKLREDWGQWCFVTLSFVLDLAAWDYEMAMEVSFQTRAPPHTAYLHVYF